MKRVVVLGGGISGLASAYRIVEQARAREIPLELIVVEAAPRVGGKVQTLRQDGFVCEAGPQGFLDNEPATLRLVDDLGLRSRLLPSEKAAARRFIYHRGRFHELSMNPLKFLASPLLSVGAKLSVAAEFFRPARRDGVEETVRQFGERRLGREFTEVMLDSMVSGIHAGDINRLSVQAAFPKIVALEENYGGLFRGMIAKQREAKRQAKAARKGSAPAPAPGRVQAGPAGTLHSFDEGMDVPITALAESIGSGNLRLGWRARRIEAHDGGYRIFLESALGEISSLRADVIVLAMPAPKMAEVFSDFAPAAAAPLKEIVTAGVHVVCLGCRRNQVKGDVKGFGALIPRGEGLRTLGVLYVHATFAGHAPEDRVLLRAMVGGRHDPAANSLGDDELFALVQEELAGRLQVDGSFEFVRMFRWNEGIPQYELGHLQRISRAREALEEHPGIFLTGNSICGIAFNACIAHSEEVGAAVAAYLKELRS